MCELTDHFFFKKRQKLAKTYYRNPSDYKKKNYFLK